MSIDVVHLKTESFLFFVNESWHDSGMTQDEFLDYIGPYMPEYVALKFDFIKWKWEIV